MFNLNTFWDTVKGHRLADVLIDCLPKLTTKKDKKEQYTIQRYDFDAKKMIDEELSKGARVVAMTKCCGDSVLVVFEKNKEW